MKKRKPKFELVDSLYGYGDNYYIVAQTSVISGSEDAYLKKIYIIELLYNAKLQGREVYRKIDNELYEISLENDYPQYMNRFEEKIRVRK